MKEVSGAKAIEVEAVMLSPARGVTGKQAIMSPEARADKLAVDPNEGTEPKRRLLGCANVTALNRAQLLRDAEPPSGSQNGCCRGFPISRGIHSNREIPINRDGPIKWNARKIMSGDPLETEI